MIPNNLRKSRKSERLAAKEIGGKRTPASGALTVMKGDVKSSLFLLEDKITDKASYSLTTEVLTKIEREAFTQRRRPLLRVTLQGKTYYVLPKNTFLDLMNGELQ